MNRIFKYFIIMILATHIASAYAQQSEKSITVSLKSNKTTPFLNEHFTITLEIIGVNARLGTSHQFDQPLAHPSLQLLSNFAQTQRMETKIVQNDKIEIQRFSCKAMLTSIEQVTLNPIIQVSMVQEKRSIVGRISRTTYQRFATEPLIIKSKQFPGIEKQKGFSKAVGKFKLITTLDKTDVAVGDLITVKMIISGEGYLDSTLPPKISAGKHFKIYNPKLVSSKPGYKEYSQTLIPQNTNAIVAPSVSYTYFDIPSSNFKTVQNGPFPIKFHSQKELVVDTRYRPDQANEIVGGGLQRVVTSEINNTEETIWDTLLNFKGKKQLMQTTEGTSGRFAPSLSAVITLPIPNEAVVNVLEIYNGWVKAEYKGDFAWIENSILTAVKDD